MTNAAGTNKNYRKHPLQSAPGFPQHPGLQEQTKPAWPLAALSPRPHSAAPMVTRWSEKGPGLKILWIWTLGTAGIMITNVVRTRVNDMQKILQEEDEAAAAAAPAASGGKASGEHVLKDDE
uniref:Uncharacterized protein n=1 Tax=Oryza brachyantha TaxID=4533 RepID=J3M2A9_ORYBR